MPICQLARSAAKHSPPSASATQSDLPRPTGRQPLPSTIASSTGIASAIRQKPTATGPTSASRTNHGPKASAALATSSAASASGGTSLDGGVEKLWRGSSCMPADRPLSGGHPVAKGNPMPSLFDSIQLGAIHAPNRILMAPLTRGRATREHVPTPIMADYYAQRASAGLIISEATGISQEGLGWPLD